MGKMYFFGALTLQNLTFCWNYKIFVGLKSCLRQKTVLVKKTVGNLLLNPILHN